MSAISEQQERDRDDERPVAAREVEPRERIAGEGGHDDREDRAPTEIQIVVSSASRIDSLS